MGRKTYGQGSLGLREKPSDRDEVSGERAVVLERKDEDEDGLKSKGRSGGKKIFMGSAVNKKEQ